MAAGNHNITIEVGATFTEDFVWTGSDGEPINLSGYTAAMKIKDPHGDLILDLAAVPGGLGVSAGEGRVTTTIPAATTATLTGNRLGRFDITLTHPSNTKRLIRGVVSFVEAIT